MTALNRHCPAGSMGPTDKGAPVVRLHGPQPSNAARGEKHRIADSHLSAHSIGAASSTSTLSIDIGIATAGRPAVLADTIVSLLAQERAPEILLVCPAEPSDVDLARIPPQLPHRVINSDRGLTAQRNALIEASDADIMLFLDDDFLPAPDFLVELERLFASDPAIVVATGAVLADGILTAGLDFQQAQSIVRAAGENRGGAPEDVYNAYGCNMAIRLAPVREHRLRFDTALPLYGWLEDVDFSRQLAPYGRIVKSARLRGVHLGTKRSGRSPGKRLGYSQIANPVYLARKGTLSWPRAFGQISRNLMANLARSPRPEPWVDRKGRLSGNVRALAELAVGRLEPARIYDID